MPHNRISLDLAQKRLVIVWFSGAGFLVLLMLLQTMRDIYGDKSGDAWGWLLPTFMPTLALMVGTLVKRAQETSDEVTVNHFMYSLSLYLSIAYLLILFLVWVLSNYFADNPLEQMKSFNVWLLVPMQGLVSLALGAFFVSQK